MFRYNIRSLFVLAIFVAILFSGIATIRAAIQTRVIASVDRSNGTRLRVTQQFNDCVEFFTTSIYFDDGDGNWRWYYFDHEDGYWGNVDVVRTGNRVVLTAGNRRIEFDMDTGDCMTFHLGYYRFHFKSERIRSLPEGVQESSSPGMK